MAKPTYVANATVFDGRRLRLVKTRLDARAGGIRVACGDGPLWVLEWEALSAG